MQRMRVRELVSTSKLQNCGCPNQMTLIDSKVGAVDLDKVVMVSYNREDKIDSVFSVKNLRIKNKGGSVK